MAATTNHRGNRHHEHHAGRELLVLKGHTGIVKALAFRDDGKVLASASSDGTVRLWDLRTGTLLHVCKGHGKAVLALAFEPAGKRLVSAGLAGGVMTPLPARKCAAGKRTSAKSGP